MWLGLDLGTQSIKAVVVDEAFTVIGAGAVEVSTHYPHPGWAEQDATRWDAAINKAIKHALRAARIPATAVKALGVSGQLDGCVAVDARGDAISPCLIWIDKRAPLPPLPADFHARTGQIADPSHMAAKIAWLQNNGFAAAARFHQPVSFVVSRLTEENVFDYALASTTMLYSLAQKDYDEALLDCFNIDRARLPKIAAADAPAGLLTERGANITGLPRGCLVAVGTGDDFATPLGAGITREGVIACVIGTAEVVGTVSHTFVLDEGALLETHAYLGDDYFVENPGWISGGAITWLSQLLGVTAQDIDELAAAAPPGSGGVTFLPALGGAMAPEWNANARACFDGLTPGHQSSHLARAVMEGCAFALRDVTSRMQSLGLNVESLCLLGGGKNSDVWAQIRSDVTGMPARVGIDDACPRGAALLAARASGMVEVQSSPAALPRIRFTPRADQRLEEAYQRYLRLYDRLYG